MALAQRRRPAVPHRRVTQLPRAADDLEEAPPTNQSTTLTLSSHFHTILLLLSVIGINLDKKSEGALNTASVEREPIRGVWGQSPQQSLRAEPLVRGQGQSPLGKAPEAESFLRIKHPKEGANWSYVRVLNERNYIILLDSNETGVLLS